MSNLEQIAKLSGFSKATVSRVLNQSRHVSQPTRDKILAIMEELDYVPNGNAISLSKGQTMQIGLVTEGINEVMLPFLNSFVETASQYGYQTIIYTSSGDPKKSCRRSRICAEKEWMRSSSAPASTSLRCWAATANTGRSSPGSGSSFRRLPQWR